MYNGTVNVLGQQVRVKNGIASFQGQQYFVSTDGKMVIDQQRNLVGQVQKGVFVPTDQAHIDEMRQKGMLE